MSSSDSSAVSCVLGVPVLKAGGKSYACSALQISMAMNSIPSATVTVGSGISIADQTADKTVNAQDLLQSVLSKRDAAYTQLIDCQITQVIDAGGVTKTLVLFKGVIVTGSVVYKAGSPTLRAIRFLCMNSACKLYVRPMSQYVNLCGGALINYVATSAKFGARDAMTKANMFKQGSIDAQQICASLQSKIGGQSLDKVVEAVADAILTAGAYAPDEQADSATNTQLSNLTDYIFSDYKIDTSTLGSSCTQEFTRMLCTTLMTSMQQASLYQAVQNCLASNDCMLNLIPRWEDKDFKIEIAPSETWMPQTPITIKDSQIISIDSNYNPIACINTPQAFVVNYSHAVELLQGQVSLDFTGMNGVYANNSNIRSVLQQIYQSKATSGYATISKQMFKTKLFYAPKWLHPAFADKAVSGQSDKKTPLSSKRCPRTRQQYKARKPQATVNKQSADSLANQIAKALFIHLYGTQDRSVVTLFPSMRFGLSQDTLQKHLGRAVDIQFQTSASLKQSPLSIRGTLHDITYEYASGQAGYVNYFIGLTCVRPLDKKEETLQCPLYKKA